MLFGQLLLVCVCICRVCLVQCNCIHVQEQLDYTEIVVNELIFSDGL